MTGRLGRRSETGSSTAIALLLGLAFVVLPVLVLVLTLPAWEQRVVDADDAARVAARVLAAAPGWTVGVSSAEEAVAEIVEGDDLSGRDLSTAFSGALEPGGEVTASVTVTVPVGDVPGLGFVGSLQYTATSTAHVDSYEGSPL